ncbi:MAG: hypothetical protein WCC57_02250 [Paracoccaceae bacterium]
MGYGELARQLAVPSPGSIAKLTEALEALMVQDAQAGRPFRAALCFGRLKDGLPAAGFFLKAQELGRYDGPVEGPQAVAYVAAERAAIFKLRAEG